MTAEISKTSNEDLANETLTGHVEKTGGQQQVIKNLSEWIAKGLKVREATKDRKLRKPCPGHDA